MGIWFLSLLINSGCNRDLVEYDSNDLKISIEKGEEWLHNFPLFLGINIKNPPQIAIWTEDMEGNYLSTVYVTHKIATQSWQASGGNRRKEALPHWCYQRGIQYEDGLYLPSKKEPLTDGISGATPKGSFNVKMSPTGKLKKFIVKIESIILQISMMHIRNRPKKETPITPVEKKGADSLPLSTQQKWI